MAKGNIKRGPIRKFFYRLQGKVAELKVRISPATKKRAARERTKCLEMLQRYERNCLEPRSVVEAASKRFHKLIELGDRLPADSRAYFYRKLKHYIFVYLPHVSDYKTPALHFEMLMNLLTPEKKFRIKPKARHVFPDGYAVSDVFVFYVKGAGEVAVLKVSDPSDIKKVKIHYVQGIKDANIKKASEVLGKRWYEVLMDKIILSALPLFENGIELLFYYNPNRTLYKKIGERYFSGINKLDSWSFVPLSPNKKRVRRLLGSLVAQLKS